VTNERWRPAYVGVGSNLGSPVEQVGSGIAAMEGIRDSVVALKSGLYRSAPLGPADQPDFINAVVALLTKLSAQDLLMELKLIETAHGRKRSSERWGPRTLDLDLLSYSTLVLAEEELILPHPGVAERNFVLLPWREIAPHYPVPGLSTVLQLSLEVPNEPRIERIV
jgi:2-amino-4-hydroxy-6-hydroxymethyldihydropteridine diphosphokinase